MNGVTAIGIQVVKQSDGNAVEVSKLLHEELEKIQKEYAAQGIVFNIAQDSSTFTLEAANAVKEDLALAVMMVAIVMLLFLHSVRNSLIVLVAIPASLITTFGFMYAMGFSLNLMTLLGMSLVIGILVDDSIVVLENIYHHLEKGEEPRSAALTGRNEIGFAALSITMVDVVVFLPLSLVSGVVGQIMRQYALVVVGATLTSLFVSFTITPMLASRFATAGAAHGTDPARAVRTGVREVLSPVHGFLSAGDRLGAASQGKGVHRDHGAVLPGDAPACRSASSGMSSCRSPTAANSASPWKCPRERASKRTTRPRCGSRGSWRRCRRWKRCSPGVGAQESGSLTFSSNNLTQLNVTLVPKNKRKRSTTEIGEEIKRTALRDPRGEGVRPADRYVRICQPGVAPDRDLRDRQLASIAARRIRWPMC